MKTKYSGLVAGIEAKISEYKNMVGKPKRNGQSEEYLRV